MARRAGGTPALLSMGTGRGFPVRRAILLLAFLAVLLAAEPGRAFPTEHNAAVQLHAYGGGDVAVGDFDGDGEVDIAWTYALGNALFLHDQAEDGFPADPPRSVALDTPTRLATGRLDGDARADLAVLTPGTIQVFTDLRQEAPIARWALSAAAAVDLALADINGDGRSDLAAVTATAVLVWFQDARAAFDTVPSMVAAMPDFQSLALRDLDADGRAEIIVAKSWEVRILSLRGGAQPVEERALYSAGSGGAVRVRAGDVDRDGRQDLVIAKADAAAGEAVLELWHQGGNGAFDPPTVILSGRVTEQFLLEDLNDDGDLDVASVHVDGGIQLWTQVGGGVFSPSTPQRLLGSDPGVSSVLAAGDVNGDTYPDLVLRGEATGTLRVFLQEDRAPALTGLMVPSNILVQEGQGIDTGIDLRAYIHDDHDAATFVAERVSGAAIEAEVVGSTLHVRAPPGVYGRASFRVHGSDGLPGHATVTTNEFTVTANAVPRVEGQAPTQIPAGEEAFYAFSVSDLFPGGERLRLVLLDAPEGMAVDAALPAVRWTPTGDQVGVHYVRLAAEDASGGRSEPTVFVVTVNPPPPPPAPDALPAVAAGGAIAALGAMAAGATVSENARWSLLGLFLPLYTKIRREDVLDHFVRGQIYGYIQSSPGEHYNAIKKALGLTNGSLAHHLKTLEREEFIRSRRFGLHRRFYPKNYRIPDSDAFFLNPIQQRLIGLVREAPGVSQKVLSERLGLTPPTVNYHVSVLMEHGYLRVEHHGRHTELFVVENGGHGEPAVDGEALHLSG
jgi:DNA-binding MarR family transcriptional regulator